MQDNTAFGPLAAAVNAGTAYLYSRHQRTDEKAVKAGKETLQKERAIRKRQHIEVTGKYSFSNVQLFLEIFETLNNLQHDKGELSKNLGHLKPVTIETGDNPTVVIQCRNLCTLRMATRAMCSDLNSFVAAIDPYLNSDNNKLHAFMLFNRSESSAIVVRISNDRPDKNVLNPVTLSFFVQSFEAAQKVQGLLILLGESGLNACPKNITNWQNDIRKQSRESPPVLKPNVEIHLDNVHSWGPAPKAFEDTPMTTTEAWQALANVFENLEIHPEAADGPLMSSKWKDNAPIFGTLRVHHGILLP